MISFNSSRFNRLEEGGRRLMRIPSSGQTFGDTQSDQTLETLKPRHATVSFHNFFLCVRLQSGDNQVERLGRADPISFFGLGACDESTRFKRTPPLPTKQRKMDPKIIHLRRNKSQQRHDPKIRSCTSGDNCNTRGFFLEPPPQHEFLVTKIGKRCDFFRPRGTIPTTGPRHGL